MAEQTTDLKAVLERLERTERRLRLLIWAVVMLFVGAVADVAINFSQRLAGPSPTVASTVVAREFLLVDETNRVRAKLQRQEDGSVGWSFSGKGETVVRGGIGVNADGALLLVARDEQGKVRLTLGQNGGRLGLRIAEADGEDRVFVGTQPHFQGLGVWDGKRIERGVFGIVNDIEDVTLRKADGKIAFEQP
jgi:hypothetical protein